MVSRRDLPGRRSEPHKSKDYLNRAMEKGYKQTRRGLDHDPSVQRFFSKSYIRHLHDWDAIVSDYLTICGDPAKVIEWKKRTEGYLLSRNYRQEVIANYLKGVEKHDDVVKRYSFLYEDLDGSRSSLSGPNRRIS